MFLIMLLSDVSVVVVHLDQRYSTMSHRTAILGQDLAGGLDRETGLRSSNNFCNTKCQKGLRWFSTMPNILYKSRSKALHCFCSAQFKLFHTVFLILVDPPDKNCVLTKCQLKRSIYFEKISPSLCGILSAAIQRAERAF